MENKIGVIIYLSDAWCSLSAVGILSPNKYGYRSSYRESTTADDCLRKTTWWLRASNHFLSATLCQDIVGPNQRAIRIMKRRQGLIVSRNLDTEYRQHILLPVQSITNNISLKFLCIEFSYYRENVSPGDPIDECRSDSFYWSLAQSEVQIPFQMYSPSSLKIALGRTQLSPPAGSLCACTFACKIQHREMSIVLLITWNYKLKII